MRRRHAILLSATLVIAAAQQPPAQQLPQNTSPLLQPADVLSHLKNSIAWYRHVNSVEQTPALANDVLLRQSTHVSSLKALQLAFDFGRVAASFVDSTSTPATPAATGGPQTRNLAQTAARATARVDNLQTRLKDLGTSLQTARGAARDTVRARRNTVQAELTLATQVRDTINTLVAFTPLNGSSGLGPQVDELERSVPEAAHQSQPAAAQQAPPTAAPASANSTAVAPIHPESSGIIGLATSLFTLSHDRGQVRILMDNTDELARSLEQVRRPLLNAVRAVVQRSETLGTISGDEDIQQLASDQHEIEALSVRFKQLSGVLVPLGEQNIVMGTVRGNLVQVVDGISAQYSEAWRYLLLRLGILGIAIGVVVLISALWRRITFRYIHDARRRTQFLTLRRVVVACAIAIVVVLSFVTEFGSLATYAGLLTAGIAVALQNVILSVVAYFFLIGKYGIRAGDRVTISGVTGNVIDIGLVRIYLAELVGTGGDLHPTGRIVVYSNSVLFQPSALFKQMPGTDYVWHTVRLVLTAESDFHVAETRLTEAVNAVYRNYGHHIDQQHANFERALDTQIAQPQPEVRLRYADAGLEVTVIYPAQIKQASLADSQMMQALQDAIAREPKLTLATAGTPRVVADAA
jgi:small-conductance mechanosensitive channel